MTAIISFPEDAIFGALRGLLLSMVPTGIEVIRAQANRVPEPKVADFIVMTPLLRTRLETNIDVTSDAIFQASIAGNEMAVSGVVTGAVYVGAVIDGAGVAPGTTITGIKKAGIYAVSVNQMVMPTTMYAGIKQAVQSMQYDIQLDVHGPISGDNTTIIATLFRDEFATQYFDSCGVDIQSLYTSEPRQVPFINAESQWESRWVVDLSLQVNQVVQVPQQFADKLHAGLIDVDAVFPP